MCFTALTHGINYSLLLGIDFWGDRIIGPGSEENSGISFKALAYRWGLRREVPFTGQRMVAPSDSGFQWC